MNRFYANTMPWSCKALGHPLILASERHGGDTWIYVAHSSYQTLLPVLSSLILTVAPGRDIADIIHSQIWKRKMRLESLYQHPNLVPSQWS